MKISTNLRNSTKRTIKELFESLERKCERNFSPYLRVFVEDTRIIMINIFIFFVVAGV